MRTGILQNFATTKYDKSRYFAEVEMTKFHLHPPDTNLVTVYCFKKDEKIFYFFALKT